MSTQHAELRTRAVVEKYSPDQVAEAFNGLMDHKRFDPELARRQLGELQTKRLERVERDIVALLDGRGEVVEHEGNMLVFGGASAYFHRLTGGTTVTAFDNTNAHLGVGDSTTAAAATQTDLQAATNKLRKAMEATYPQHTDGTTSANDEAIFRSLFGTSEANFAWQEWGLFNASTAGRMLNRKVESFGTKVAGSIWTLTVTLSLA